MVSTTTAGDGAIVVEKDAVRVVSIVVLAYLIRTYASIEEVSP